MLKGTIIVLIMLAFAQVQTREMMGSNINGDVDGAMSSLHQAAIGHCGFVNLRTGGNSGYEASNVRCVVEPRTLSGQINAVCRATITCTNRPQGGPPPTPQARPQ
jgi:hypothetical protein